MGLVGENGNRIQIGDRNDRQAGSIGAISVAKHSKSNFGPPRIWRSRLKREPQQKGHNKEAEDSEQTSFGDAHGWRPKAITAPLALKDWDFRQVRNSWPARPLQFPPFFL